VRSRRAQEAGRKIELVEYVPGTPTSIRSSRIQGRGVDSVISRRRAEERKMLQQNEGARAQLKVWSRGSHAGLDHPGPRAARRRRRCYIHFYNPYDHSLAGDPGQPAYVEEWKKRGYPGSAWWRACADSTPLNSSRRRWRWRRATAPSHDALRRAEVRGLYGLNKFDKTGRATEIILSQVKTGVAVVGVTPSAKPGTPPRRNSGRSDDAGGPDRARRPACHARRARQQRVNGLSYRGGYALMGIASP